MKLFTALSATEHSDLIKAKAEMSERYLSAAAIVKAGTQSLRALTASNPLKNVVGVGVDEKYVDGVPTGMPTVKFLVMKKFPPSYISKKELLPKAIAGFATDVEEVGLIIPHKKRKAAAPTTTMPNPQIKIRPAQPGCSIGFKDPKNEIVMAGTFGLVVKDNAGDLYILSNNHVLAYESGIQADGVTKRVGLPEGRSHLPTRPAGRWQRPYRSDRQTNALAQPACRPLRQQGRRGYSETRSTEHRRARYPFHRCSAGDRVGQERYARTQVWADNRVQGRPCFERCF